MWEFYIFVGCKIQKSDLGILVMQMLIHLSPCLSILNLFTSFLKNYDFCWNLHVPIVPLPSQFENN